MRNTNKQKIVLRELAKTHGLSVAQAEEIWSLLLNKISEVISEEDKMVNGYFDETKFQTIHIGNFGKFIPNLKKIYYANLCLKKKNDGN